MALESGRIIHDSASKILLKDSNSMNNQTNQFDSGEDEFDVEGQMKMPFHPAFMEKEIRIGFIRKVFGIVGVQLFLTMFMTILFVSVQSIRFFFYLHDYIWILCWVLSMVMVLVLACSEKTRKSYPMNYICLGAFTLFMGLTVSVSASTYDAKEVGIAAGITTILVASIVLFSFQTKYDFTQLHGYLLTGSMSLLMFGIFSLVFWRNVEVLHILYSSVAAFLFSAYLIYDIHVMMGAGFGKRRQIDPEEYILASLNIYLDVILIFNNILRLVGIR